MLLLGHDDDLLMYTDAAHESGKEKRGGTHSQKRDKKIVEA